MNTADTRAVLDFCFGLEEEEEEKERQLSYTE
jgi:hypothetical protein